jgi:hypothetical protein
MTTWMMRTTMLVAVTFVTTILATAAVAAPNEEHQVWLAGIDPVVSADRQRIGMTNGTASGATRDFAALFQPNAPWSRSAAAIQVFKVSTQFLHRGTDEQLLLVLNDLRRRHMPWG